MWVRRRGQGDWPLPAFLVLMDISILNLFLLWPLLSCTHHLWVHFQSFKKWFLYRNFNEMWLICIPYKRKNEFLFSNPIRSPIRVLISSCDKVFTPLGAVRRVVFWRNFPIHTSAAGASLLELDFFLYILRFRLCYLLTNGRHPRWALYSFFLPLKWKVGRVR